MECMEDGFLAKIVKEEGAKEIQVGEVWEFLSFGDLFSSMGSQHISILSLKLPFRNSGLKIIEFCI